MYNYRQFASIQSYYTMKYIEGFIIGLSTRRVYSM